MEEHRMKITITDHMIQTALNAGRWHGPGGISAETMRAVLQAVAPAIAQAALEAASVEIGRETGQALCGEPFRDGRATGMREARQTLTRLYIAAGRSV
jgi:hypothetical protein